MIDLLIIGSGGAALSCAIEANKKGLKTFIASKTPPTWSQTTQAQGGINAAMGANDSVKMHYDDTLKAALGLANETMVQKLCENAKDSILWLDDLGVVFNKDTKGDFMLRSLGGASAKRACFAQDYTGLKIMHTLYDNARQLEHKESYFLVELFVQNGKCIGALFFDIDNECFETVFAKEIVLATGGYAGIYSGYSTNSEFATADGIAAAKKAGCKLSHLEFVQFHPTALAKSKALISESARGEGGYLINSNGERFVDELAPRDKVAQAIAAQIRKGQKVFLDIRHLGKEFIDNFMPQEYKLAKFYEGVDALVEPIPIVPAAHYSMGGIAVDENFQTTIQNLYAIGECSDSQVHGANRLGGNSLLEIVTFGRLLGKSLGKEQKLHTLKVDTKEYEKEFAQMMQHKEGKNARALKEKIGAMMFESAGVFKERQKMIEAKEFLQNLNLEGFVIGGGKGYSKVLELRNSVCIALEVIEASLQRKESLGAHCIGGVDA